MIDFDYCVQDNIPTVKIIKLFDELSIEKTFDNLSSLILSFEDLKHLCYEIFYTGYIRTSIPYHDECRQKEPEDFINQIQKLSEIKQKVFWFILKKFCRYNRSKNAEFLMDWGRYNAFVK